MYSLTATQKQIFWKPSYTHVSITYEDGQGVTQTITQADVLENSFVINRASSSGTNIQLGAAIMAELDFELNNISGRFDPADLLGKELFVTVTACSDWDNQTSSNTVIVPFGYFTVDEVRKKGATALSVVTFDRMARFDNPATSLATAGAVNGKTAQWLVQRICTLCNVPYGSITASDFGNYTSPTLVEPDNWVELATESTYRQILMWVLERSGAVGYVNYNGEFRLGQYVNTLPTNYVELTTANRRSSTLGENDVVITGIKANVGENAYTTGTDAYRLVVDQNPFFTDDSANTLITNLYSKLNGYTYRPFAAEALPTPNLEPCDRIYFTEADDTQHATLVMNWTYRLNGSTTMSATSDVERVRGYASGNQLTRSEQAVIEKIRKATNAQLSELELATTHISEIAANTLGYYLTEETQLDGSKITYWHDRPTLGQSTIIYKRGASGFFLSQDGGATYTQGFDSSGNAVLNILDAIGIRADWVQTGLLTDQANINYWNLQTGAARFSGDIVANSLTLGSNVTIPYSKISNKPDLTVYVEQGHQYGTAASASNPSVTGFKVTSAGLLTASNAVIYGSIYATSLTLGTNVTIASGKVSGLATVATSGSYNDLSNKPTIPSLNGYIYVDGTVGSTPASGATGFKVSNAGLLTASNAVIWGKLYSSEGTIGGMTLSNNSMYSGTNSMSSTTAGVYIGTGGIRLYGSSSAYFNVTNQGAVTVVGGSITGSTFKSSDGKTQLDGTGLTLRDGASDAASTRKLSLLFSNTEPKMSMYYRANTSASWTENGSIMFSGTGIKLNVAIVDASYFRIGGVNIINTVSGSVVVRGDAFYTTGGTALLSVDSSSNVLVGGKTPVYTSTDQTIGGTKTFTNWPVIRYTTGSSSGINFQFSNGATANGRYGMIFLAYANTSGRVYFRQYSGSSSGVTTHYDQFALPATAAGKTADNTYDILTSKSAVSIAQGGTGATTVAGARNALGLGNTSGALPIANGGTGATTAAAARNALGLGNTSGALPIANGGTGQTTAAAARNALGLGNTTGALPIANGGTGATTVAAARNALGLGNTSGAVPVANGGTGSTTAIGARGALGVNTELINGSIGATDVTLTNAYSNASLGWIVRGIPGTTAYSTCFIPKVAVTTSNTIWQVTDETSYIVFHIRYSGNNLIIGGTTTGKTIAIYRVG